MYKLRTKNPTLNKLKKKNIIVLSLKKYVIVELVKRFL